jgi:hypothetical protein
VTDEAAVGSDPKPRQDQPDANSASAHRQSETEKANRGQKRIQLSVIVAIISALAAMGSAVYSYSQVQVSKQQEIFGEQQQLLTLVAAIEQEPAQLAGAVQNMTGNALTQTDIAYETELQADGAAAASIISALHGQGVAGVEYIQVGVALQSGYSNALALKYYADGVALSNNPETTADGLRYEAILRYELGGSQNDTAAHQEMERAVAEFSGPYFYRNEIEQNAALTYLLDAEYQIPLRKDCDIARADLSDARRAVMLLGSTAIYIEERNQNLLTSDQNSFNLYCSP